MNESNRITVGDRLVIYTRGKKKIYIADFWAENQHKKVSLKTTNKKVAVEMATKIAANLISGTFSAAPKPIGISDAAGEYVRTLEVNHRARKTTVKYAGILTEFATTMSRIGINHLTQVTARHFDSYRAERTKIRHRKTVYNESIVIKQLFKWARSRRLILEDPLSGIGLNKPARESKPAPTIHEINHILSHAVSPLKDYLSVLAFSGMRVGELQRLKPEDVDLEKNWIHIVSRYGLETKTRQSRKVPIHHRLRPIFEALPRHNRPWLFTAVASKKYPGGDHWISDKKVNDKFAKLLTQLDMKAGRVDGFVVHSLRHFFETFTVNASIPQRVIDAWLGHSFDQSMAAVYYRLNDADSQNFMSQVPFGTYESAVSADKECLS